MSKTRSVFLMLFGMVIAVAGYQATKTDREIARRLEATRELNAEMLKVQKKEFENRMEDIRLMR